MYKNFFFISQNSFFCSLFVCLLKTRKLLGYRTKCGIQVIDRNRKKKFPEPFSGKEKIQPQIARNEKLIEGNLTR